MPPLPGPPPKITGSWDEQVTKYRSLVVQAFPGIYNGNNPAQYKGLTFPQIFDAIIASKPHGVMNPQSAYQATALLWITAKLAGVIIATAGGTASFTNTSEQGISRGIAQFTSPLQFLTSGQFWVRAGEIAIGLVLVAVGILKLAEDNGLASSLVNHVPVVKAAKGLLK